jgi:RND family efflux transporter MFP subunit
MKGLLRDKRMVWATVTAIVLAGAVGGWFLLERTSGEGALKVASQLKTQPVSKRDFKRTADWIGRVESTGSVKIFALGPGRIVSVIAETGVRVRQGAPLFKVGGPILNANVRDLQARVASMKKRLALARAIVARKRGAAKTRVVSENDLAAAEGEAARVGAELKSAQAGLRALEAQMLISSPVSGVFTDRAVNEGQDVEKGTLLAEVLAPKKLRIVATTFPPPHARLEGRPAKVRVGGGAMIDAHVATVFPDLTPEGGTRVWIDCPGLAEHAAVGAHVSGQIELESHNEALAVPRSAVVYDKHELPYVFVKKDGQFVMTSVNLGLSDSGWNEVVSGVGAGDDIVVDGAYELFYKNYSKTYKVED